MSVLSIIQDHCRMHALAVPTAVIGSTDTGTVQLQAILDDLVKDIVRESKFNGTTQEAIFNTSLTEDQGSMSTLAPNGFTFAIFETFFNRTQGLPLIGPVDEREWQALKALPSAGIQFKFRIRGNHLLLNPVPTTTQVIAFEYSSAWAYTDTLSNAKSSITADTDNISFPDSMLRKGLAYRWKRIKGLPYMEDRTDFYNALNNFIARDKVKRRINVGDSNCQDLKPGVFVPTNSWMQ